MTTEKKEVDSDSSYSSVIYGEIPCKLILLCPLWLPLKSLLTCTERPRTCLKNSYKDIPVTRIARVVTYTS